MGIKYRDNETWDFVVIRCKASEINKSIEDFFKEPDNMSKYGTNINILESEIYDRFDQHFDGPRIDLLVKFARRV